MSKQNEIITGLALQYLSIENLATSDDDYQTILDRLKPQIQYLLDKDLQTLLNALYRIDVDENKFKFILEQGLPDEISEGVSKLILDRIILKAQTRLKYQ